MCTVAALLKQPVIIEELMSHLQAPGGRVWLKGPSGAGKSTIAGNILAKMTTQGPTLRVCGDAGHAGTKYLVLYRALEASRTQHKKRELMKSCAVAALHAIPVVGTMTAELAQIAVNAEQAGRLDFLTAEQHTYLTELQSHASNEQLVLVVDDIGYLDKETAELIYMLQLPEVRATYSFALTASILFIENSEAAPTLDEYCMRRLMPLNIVTMQRAPRSVFPLVLKEFGLQAPIASEAMDAVYSIAGGHLAIAKELVHVLNASGSEYAIMKNCSKSSFVKDILLQRINRTECAPHVKNLLFLAACVGSAFTEEEIRCAFTDEKFFQKSLEIALREIFFLEDGDVYRFSHDVIRETAETIGTQESQRMHANLAACIKVLRPGDYASRLKHAELAGDSAQAHELAFALSMQGIRGGSVSLAHRDMGPLEAVLHAAREAYRLMDSGSHTEAIALMTEHYTGQFSLSQGEVVGLIALNHIKRRTLDGYDAAANLLENWIDYKDEIEQWHRLMSILATAWAACNDGEKAKKLHARLGSELANASRHDPTMRTRIESLGRKADQFLTCELSIKHIQRAVSWFAPEEHGDTPRNSFEYTASLINLSGVQYTLGQFQSAAAAAQKALHWIDVLHKRGIRTAESYKALNNYVISAFRAGVDSAAIASDALELLITSNISSWKLDRALVAINHGALLLLANRTDRARLLLEAVWEHTSEEYLDAYYRLYAGSNLAVALALTGERERGKELLSQMSSFFDGVPSGYRKIHTRRCDMMLKAMDDFSLQTAKDFDAFPALQRKPVNEQDAWWSIGHGLLMSDIQVWSEG